MNIQAAGNAAERSLPSGLSDPETVRYIKPGEGGQWLQMAFDSGMVPFDCYGDESRRLPAIDLHDKGGNLSLAANPR